MILSEPYFMTNEAWYTYDEDEMVYKLTDKAPQKAVDSYNAFYGEVEKVEDGEIINK